MENGNSISFWTWIPVFHLEPRAKICLKRLPRRGSRRSKSCLPSPSPAALAVSIKMSSSGREIAFVPLTSPVRWGEIG